MFVNFKKLIEVEPKSRDRFDVLDGIRSISMIWIIAGHGFSAWLDRMPSINQGEIPKVQLGFNFFYNLICFTEGNCSKHR